MKKFTNIILPALFMAFISLTGCDDQGRNPVPLMDVDINISMADPKYQGLQLKGGFAYVDGAYGGLVVIHTYEDTWVAYDRTCTFHPQEQCARVVVDSSAVFLRCGHYGPTRFNPCCETRYHSYTGTVLDGPAVHPLRGYRIAINGMIINIYD